MTLALLIPSRDSESTLGYRCCCPHQTVQAFHLNKHTRCAQARARGMQELSAKGRPCACCPPAEAWLGLAACSMSLLLHSTSGYSSTLPLHPMRIRLSW